ncbi:hypothetical protein HMPREF3033_01139 [Veillonellaceae bacterium DNF00751]|uniref:Uncharacterized protein n=1 Tax=Megasphaera lornae TaxID=1000568 RepID=D3LSK2_9FIRM|nr:hypothetical protein HMPREF0889_0940 [Megasphaera genomosp. type_1 str. 28L]EGL41061.1 hypothetical protein HMPREF1039_1353 [Megasphaera lornae]KXB91244.1 hypothetical protein HMPREF3033_01139 [Veillonellaceae bacterium DNF00751]
MFRFLSAYFFIHTLSLKEYNAKFMPDYLKKYPFLLRLQAKEKSI